MAKESTLQVVSAKNETAEKTKQAKAKAAELSKELNELREKVEKKGYLVEGGAAAGEKLIDWLTTSASWKFTEAMGVMEAIKQVKSGIEEIKKGKTKELLLNNLSLEAIYYFISKEEGKGLEQATFYVEHLLKPVADGLGRAKVDKDRVKDLEFKVASLEQGLEVNENTSEDNGKSGKH
jgi:hypothetical protein